MTNQHNDATQNVEGNAENNATPENQDKCKSRREHCRDRRCGPGRFFVGALALVGVLSLGGMLFGASCGHAGWGGSHHEMSAEDMQHKAEYMTKRLIKETDATDAQAESIKAIVNSYTPQLHPMREVHKQQRDAFASALKAEQVDAAQLQSIRASGIEDLNQHSKVLVQMVEEIANVLNAEQRVALIDEMQSRRHFW